MERINTVFSLTEVGVVSEVSRRWYGGISEKIGFCMLLYSNLDQFQGFLSVFGA